MDENECRTLIAAARGSAGWPLSEVLGAIDDAAARFSAEAAARFGKPGEW
jgi:hypothetical protein